MGHNTLTCESSSANSFTLLRHEKTTLWERVRGFVFVLALVEASGCLKKIRIETEVESLFLK